MTTLTRFSGIHFIICKSPLMVGTMLFVCAGCACVVSVVWCTSLLLLLILSPTGFYFFFVFCVCFAALLGY